MGRACPAALHQPLVKCGAGPMQPHRSIVARDALRQRVLRDVMLGEVYLTERICVFGLERLDQIADALAYGTEQRGIFADIGGLVGDGIKRAALGTGPPVVIDQRVAKQPIKPRLSRFLTAQRFPASDRANERFLKQVLGDGARSHAPFEKREKPRVAADEASDHVRGRREFSVE